MGFRSLVIQDLLSVLLCSFPVRPQRLKGHSEEAGGMQTVLL